jgi:heme exporter protein C
MQKPLPKNAAFLLVAFAALVLVPGAILWVFFGTPVEANLGIVQKIFYFHVPSAFMMYTGYGIAFLGSIGYLMTRAKDDDAARKYDEYASTGAELGLLFGAIVLTSGPIWARKSWGTFWTWDPQLTATLLVFVLFLSYAAVRAFAARGERRKLISAIIAILATPNIAFIHWAITVTHPKILRGKKDSLPLEMWMTLFLCLGVIVVLFAALYWLRLRIERERNEVSRMREDVLIHADRRAAAGASALSLVPFYLLFQVTPSGPKIADEFVPATGPTEAIPGGDLLVLAYAVIWVLVLGFVILLWRRQAKVFSEVVSLKKQLDGLEKKDR